MTSPTARSLALLRASGYTVDVAERYLAAVRRKRDLLGFADIVGIRPGVAGVLAVQATTKGHVNDRFTRIRQLPALLLWLQCGNAAEIHGWFQKPNGRWDVRRVVLLAEDLRNAIPPAPPARKRRRKGRMLF